jgi:hypothetical protein
VYGEGASDDASDGAGDATGDPGKPPARPAAAARITLIGKPGCHLCDEARTVISAVSADLGVTWEELSILDDAELAARYWEQIPVTLVDGRQHDFWRVDEQRLRDALAGRRRWFGGR